MIIFIVEGSFFSSLQPKCSAVLTIDFDDFDDDDTVDAIVAFDAVDMVDTVR